MKRKRVIPINTINITVIIIVMIFVAMLTQNIIKELTIKDIQNVTRLTQTNIFNEIKQEMDDPIISSLIMAQNTLLHDFMNEDTIQTEEKMSEYLSAIQKKTGYESVFVVPDSTLNYYHPGGTDEKVDLESEHAYWYTNRINAKDDYGFVVNTENLDDWALTIYVDANINDKNGNFVGITGVGKRINHIQNILTRYKDNQGVKAYIVDSEGSIKIHEDNKYIKNTTLYEFENLSPKLIEIKENEGVPIEYMIDNSLFIIQYIPKLEWYLVVKKNTSELTGILNHYRFQIIIAIIFAASVIFVVTNYTISKYKKQIINLSNIDYLTDISNRTIFEEKLQIAVKNIEYQDFCLAIFDVDNLKKINDSLGHDKGDQTLKLIAELAKSKFNSTNLISRIGGDEFAVIIYKPLKEAKVFVNKFHKAINSNIKLQQLGATVSIGLTEALKLDSRNKVYKRADKALYKSKNEGKNRIKIQ